MTIWNFSQLLLLSLSIEDILSIPSATNFEDDILLYKVRQPLVTNG